MQAIKREEHSHRKTKTKLSSASGQIDDHNYIRNDLAHSKEKLSCRNHFFHCLPGTVNIFSKKEKEKINIISAFCCCTLTGAGQKEVGYVGLLVPSIWMYLFYYCETFPKF